MTATASLSYLRPPVAAVKAKLDRFVQEECIPAEREFDQHLGSRHGPDRWTRDAVPPCLERLKARARELGLWNLFIPPHLIPKIPDSSLAPTIGGLSYREYGILCESLGRCPHLAPEACNSSAPDTGNMEVLLEFATPAQRQAYLVPLLRGEIRSCFLMTEPDVASSDPTNLQTILQKQIVVDTTTNNRHRVEYVLKGRKWWSTGAMDPRCRVALVVARMDYSHPSCQNVDDNNEDDDDDTGSFLHGAHTVVAVPMPHPGVKVIRPLTVFGYDDAPHGHAEVVLDNVRLTQADLIAGEGSGFRVAQARLGPGRIHHCMRAVGMAARCYELMLQRSMERETFGKKLYEHGGCQEMIADSVADLEAARLMTLSCAAAMDAVGAKQARDKISTIKVAVPELTYRVIDRAVQVFGGAGVSDDFILARALAALRSLRIADGPDSVHRRTVARLEVRKAQKKKEKAQAAAGAQKPQDIPHSRL